ncbi:MAG: hypothetical protein ACI9MR_001920 [Myxococcota bacterium]|jgi:hypothetical protein
MRRFLMAWMLLLASTALAMPACDDDAGCRDDFDCGSALVCKVSSGACEALVCKADANCDGSLTCNDNVCE